MGALEGPLGEITIPVGAGIGGGLLGGYGAIKGGQLGYAIGQAACSTGTGSGGGGNRAGGAQRLTNSQAKQAANELGYDQEVKDPPFDSHGSKVFSNGKTLISADRDVHSGGVWKMYDWSGNRLGTYDANLVRIGN